MHEVLNGYIEGNARGLRLVLLTFAWIFGPRRIRPLTTKLGQPNHLITN